MNNSQFQPKVEGYVFLLRYKEEVEQQWIEEEIWVRDNGKDDAWNKATLHLTKLLCDKEIRPRQVDIQKLFTIMGDYCERLSENELS